MRRVLLFDRSGEDVEGIKFALQRRGFHVDIEDQQWRAVQELHHPVPEWEYVVLVSRSAHENDVELLRELIVASQQFHQSDIPQFLFASYARCAPMLRVRIGSLGARHVHL